MYPFHLLLSSLPLLQLPLFRSQTHTKKIEFLAPWKRLQVPRLQSSWRPAIFGHTQFQRHGAWPNYIPARHLVRQSYSRHHYPQYFYSFALNFSITSSKYKSNFRNGFTCACGYERHVCYAWTQLTRRRATSLYRHVTSTRKCGGWPNYNNYTPNNDHNDCNFHD